MPSKLQSVVFDFIDDLDTCSGLADLIAKFQALIEQFGMRCFAVGDATTPKLRRVDRFWASTYPEEWAKIWIEKDYISVDPVIYQLFMQPTPFRWSDLRKRQSGTGAMVMDAARDFRLNDGLSIGAHALRGGMVGLTMAGERVELDRQDEMLLHMACIYFETKLQAFLKVDTPDHCETLSARERDCLSWVAAGKTDWEISQILGIAENTAKEYVLRATRKLNATTRAQAAAIAVARRIIHL
jgi:LuxR family quorum sensing-dependent transcriptional regulator